MILSENCVSASLLTTLTHADIQKSLLMRTQCWRRHLLLWWRNDNADTEVKFWRPLTHVNGTIKRKKVLGCVYLSNSNISKIVCPRSSWLCGHAYFEFVNVEYPCKQEQFCETDLAAARMSKTIEVEYFVTLTL